MALHKLLNVPNLILIGIKRKEKMHVQQRFGTEVDKKEFINCAQKHVI